MKGQKQKERESQQRDREHMVEREKAEKRER
jgi:hypothetical protein